MQRSKKRGTRWRSCISSRSVRHMPMPSWAKPTNAGSTRPATRSVRSSTRSFSRVVLKPMRALSRIACSPTICSGSIRAPIRVNAVSSGPRWNIRRRTELKMDTSVAPGSRLYRPRSGTTSLARARTRAGRWYHPHPSPDPSGTWLPYQGTRTLGRTLTRRTRWPTRSPCQIRLCRLPLPSPTARP